MKTAIWLYRGDSGVRKWEEVMQQLGDTLWQQEVDIVWMEKGNDSNERLM